MLPGIKLFELSGRVAVVTGGSKGLGAAMASGLASAGADLVLVSRHQEELESAAEQIKSQFNVQITCYQGDVTSSDRMESIVESVI
ncbi:MAG: SDR family NAD(P)-dependent oxidoreductase, partial [Planctomycetota bacterium]|nr:SDR family NAD(P)-dependent oxidoreductase [Planctomycetota bacterium]